MKKILREKYKAIRKNIKDKTFKEEIIKKKVLLLAHNYQTIGIYVSLEDEVNTDEIIKELLKMDKKVYVPKVDGKRMDFYRIYSLDEIEISNNKYHLREPINLEEKINPADVELMITPGLAFDMNNNRLGYGGGYYDRYLKDLSCFKVGICFKEQLIDSLITDENDVLMDIVIND